MTSGTAALTLDSASERTGPITVGPANLVAGVGGGDATFALEPQEAPLPAAGRALETNTTIDEGDARELSTRIGELRRLLALNKTFNGELNVRISAGGSTGCTLSSTCSAGN